MKDAKMKDNDFATELIDLCLKHNIILALGPDNRVEFLRNKINLYGQDLAIMRERVIKRTIVHLDKTKGGC